MPPTTSASCDGSTGYQGGTVTVQPDGSVDVINTSSAFGTPFTVYALPDVPTLHENPSGNPVCGLGVANECMLYIGQGGGGDVGFAQPHFFSQAFQVHPDPTDSGTLNPGDGSPAPTTAVSSSLSTVTPASQTVTADGLDHADVTVTLNDQNSVGVSGKTVNLAATGAATVVPAASGSEVTDANGQAKFFVKDTTAQTVTLTASDTTDTIGVTQTAQATFSTPTLDAAASKVSANPTSVPSDGTTASTVTVLLLDNSVNGSPAPLAGLTVQLSAGSGSSVILPASAGSNVTDASGQATFSVTDSVNQSVTYQATIGTTTLTSTATVVFGTGQTVSATASTVVASPSPAFTGNTGTEVTVTLLAADGKTVVAGKSVTLTVKSPSGGALIIGTNPQTTDATGKAVFPVTDQHVESVTITATDTTDNDLVLVSQPVVAFEAPPPPTISPTLSTAVVSGSPAPADGFTEAVVAVTVINTAGATVSGVAVNVTASPQDGANVEAVGGVNTSNANGVVQFGARDTTAETLTFTASVVGGVTFTARPTATFLAGSPDANKSTVSASPMQVPADGTTASTVTVTLTDYFGNPIAGVPISLKAAKGSSVITPVQVVSGVTPGVTDAKGVAQFSVTDATTEVVTYSAIDTASALTLSHLVVVTFGTPPPVVPTKADCDAVVNDSKIPADGKTSATITVELRDADGDPVSGKTVSLTPSGGISVITAGSTAAHAVTASGPPAPKRALAAAAPITVVSNSNGNALFEVTDTAVETVTYTAADTTDSMSGWTVAVAFTAAAPTTTTTTSTTSTTTPASAATTPTTPATGSPDAGVGSATDSGSSNPGSGGTGAATGSSLAFTGAPAALPWMFGLGAVLLLFGALGRGILAARKRDQ